MPSTPDGCPALKGDLQSPARVGKQDNKSCSSPFFYPQAWIINSKVDAQRSWQIHRTQERHLALKTDVSRSRRIPRAQDGYLALKGDLQSPARVGKQDCKSCSSPFFYPQAWIINSAVQLPVGRSWRTSMISEYARDRRGRHRPSLPFRRGLPHPEPR